MAGADLISTASGFKDNFVEVSNEFPDIVLTIIRENVIDQCENGNTQGVDFAISQSVLYKEDPVISAQFATSIVKEVGNAVYGVIGEYLDEGTLPFGEDEIKAFIDENCQ